MHSFPVAFPNLPIRPLFHNFVNNFFYKFFKFFFMYIKMSKNSLAKYYQENKERLHRKAHERHQILSKEDKKKTTKWLPTIRNLSEDRKSTQVE